MRAIYRMRACKASAAQRFARTSFLFLGRRTLYRCMMGGPFRCQLLVTPYLCPYPCAIHCLESRRKRPGRIGCVHFQTFVRRRRLPDRHGSDKTVTPDSRGDIDLKTSILKMRMASADASVCTSRRQLMSEIKILLLPYQCST